MYQFNLLTFLRVMSILHTHLHTLTHPLWHKNRDFKYDFQLENHDFKSRL